MMVAALDIHKHVLQVVVLDPETGEVEQERFAAAPAALDDWAMRRQASVAVIAIEATTGWRWTARLLQARGFDVRLADPTEARALRGKKRRAKTDRLDARWLALLLAKEMLPQAWLPPEEIQRLRDQTRLRQALVEDRTRWAQRLHALLTHEGWPVARARLLTIQGRRWAAALPLSAAAHAQVEMMLRLLAALDSEIETLESELRRFARTDPRTRALLELRGVGPTLACILLAEIGDARRFRRARQITRAAGLDPSVLDSADNQRRGRLAKAGSPQLRFALVEAATWSGREGGPDRELYLAARARAGAQRANLTVARKVGRRVYHVLRALEPVA